MNATVQASEGAVRNNPTSEKMTDSFKALLELESSGRSITDRSSGAEPFHQFPRLCACHAR